MDIKNAFLLGIIGYLSTALEALKGSLAVGGEAEEQVKGLAVIYLLYEDELMVISKKSSNPYDDAFFAEFGEVARKILSPILVDELEKLRSKPV